MFGEAILARSITAARIKDAHGNAWQYHSRSDRHSKMACWAVLFDLLQTCSLLRDQVAAGKVGFGINHEMRDYKQDRKKNLDLVLCTHQGAVSALSFAAYGEGCGVILTPQETELLEKLPKMRQAGVTNVLVALEAKACMTEHVKAVPRLHDELSSSHQTIHGDTGGAIAAGYVLINCADSFISPDRNRKRVRGGKFIVNAHRQPAAAEKSLAAIVKIPRRSMDSQVGFDGVGVTMLRCANDGSEVSVDELANAKITDILKYESFVTRLAHLYATKFGAI
jgi:hypothetical protein